MSRLSKVGRSGTNGKLREVFDSIAATRGNIPNMYRVMAQRPDLATTMHEHFEAAMKPTTLSSRLKEMLALQTSLANSCHY
jgi:alkylhydroperoxidase/carboxymuconolactone decarboxylase family protein YurZ